MSGDTQHYPCYIIPAEELSTAGPAVAFIDHTVQRLEGSTIFVLTTIPCLLPLPPLGWLWRVGRWGTWACEWFLFNDRWSQEWFEPSRRYVLLFVLVSETILDQISGLAEMHGRIFLCISGNANRSMFPTQAYMQETRWATPRLVMDPEAGQSPNALKVTSCSPEIHPFDFVFPQSFLSAQSSAEEFLEGHFAFGIPKPRRGIRWPEHFTFVCVQEHVCGGHKAFRK